MKNYENIRLNKIIELIEGNNLCGKKGCIFELSCARVNSRKTGVSAQGRPDVAVKLQTGDKVRYVPAECKTNGGRVTDLLDGSNKSKYVIYWLSTDIKHPARKSHPAYIEHRELPPVIMPTELFLAVLKACNALKVVNRNGKPDGIAIQVSSKSLYEWLQDYPIVFDRNATYTPADFEGFTV